MMKLRSMLSLLGWLVLLTLALPAGTWAAVDLDNDGKGDLVWGHARTGSVGVWLMDGLTMRQGRVVETVPDLDWRIVGLGDVDGDGKGDLVWLHSPTGQVGVWLMDGVTLREFALVATLADLGWQIVAVGDLDGDGRVDLVRQHSTTGAVAVWRGEGPQGLMDGVSVGEDVTVAAAVDLRWQIVGVGDVDGDGKGDLVWRHTLTGQVGAWLMDGVTLREAALIATLADPGWQLVGIGDVDGDGTDDLVWHHARDGEVRVWLMSGAFLRENAAVLTIDDLGWQIVGVNDVDGNGRADLVWRHTPTGQVGIWLMDGAAVRQAAAVQTVADLDWQVQPARPPRITALADGVPRTGSIETIGQMGLFQFVIDAPARVIVQATSRAINPCLAIYAGNLAQPVSGGQACAPDKSGKFTRLDLILGAGRYLATVHDAQDNDDGTYNMLVLPLTAAASTPLTAGAEGPEKGKLGVIGEIHLYQFSVDSPTRVVVEATRRSGGISPCVELYTGTPAQPVSGGTACAENTADGRVGSLDMELAAGTYFAAVYDAGHDDKGFYNVLMLPLTAATSTSLSAGVPQTGTILDRGDVNLHQFILEAATRVVLQVTRSSGGTTGINPCLEVYTGVPAQPVAGGAVCADDTPITGRVGRLDVTLPAGTYFVAIRDAGGADDGDYTILMLPLTGQAGASLALGVPYVGTIVGVGEMDLYQFSLQAPAHVQVQVTRAAKDSWVNPCLEVYTGSPAQPVSGGAVCAVPKAEGKMITLDLSLPAGTYFAVVYDAGDDDVGDYTVVATAAPSAP